MVAMAMMSFMARQEQWLQEVLCEVLQLVGDGIKSVG